MLRKLNLASCSSQPLAELRCLHERDDSYLQCWFSCEIDHLQIAIDFNSSPKLRFPNLIFFLRPLNFRTSELTLSYFNMKPSISTLVETAAISVATILGTGILGLPVALHASGIRPFLLLFSINFCTQLGVVTAMTQLLQYAYVDNQTASSSDQHKLLSISTSENSSSSSSTDIVLINQQSESPSLHSLATRYIPNRLIRNFFNILVLLHFLFILSAYALAGPQAYCSLFTVFKSLPSSLITILFVLICATAVIFARHTLIHVLTAGTILKASLLTLLVAVTLGRGLTIQQPTVNNWKLSALLDPFLMGTIALSGVANLMPVTFQACVTNAKSLAADGEQVVDRAFIRAYRNTTFLAVLFCYVVNIAWSTAVLLIVPQDISQIVTNNEQSSQQQITRISSNVTLTDANERGQISTVPLIEVLSGRDDKLDFIIALLVDIFIVVSITISFMVMAIGLLHYTDSQSKSVAESRNHDPKYYQYALSFGSFSIVLSIAVLNPSGFIKIMEGLTTLFLNLEAGLFVIYMLYITRNRNTQIPAPLTPNNTVGLIGFVATYFIIAIFVDIVFFLPKAIF